MPELRWSVTCLAGGWEVQEHSTSVWQGPLHCSITWQKAEEQVGMREQEGTKLAFITSLPLQQLSHFQKNNINPFVRAGFMNQSLPIRPYLLTLWHWRLNSQYMKFGGNFRTMVQGTREVPLSGNTAPSASSTELWISRSSPAGQGGGCKHKQTNRRAFFCFVFF